ncbi:hypothetical protein SAMN05443244_3948 [Terriglobus roseus]|uniref:Uncharacterized protein n=1 Tax=Terriglobus roseus TaxID=392734 RepID=A0A1H4U471_9BACT|nr:hypothetical protein SAMN05443244_3948 [Terriglobus roseus]
MSYASRFGVSQQETRTGRYGSKAGAFDGLFSPVHSMPRSCATR